MSSVFETQQSRLTDPRPVTLKNSPVFCGLGTLGLEAAFKVFAGYYMFFYVDELGLAVTLAIFVVAIAVVSSWSRLVRKWGIKRTWLWAIGVMALSAILLGLAPNLAGGILAAAIAGIGLGGVKVCRELILATLVDQSRKRSGQRREGVYYSLNRFIGRLSKILEALALALLGVLFGYVSGENPGPDPENALRFLISVFPFICLVLAWVLARRLDFEGAP